MPVLRLCCCCCRLQTGGVVLGYIESFISLIILIVGIILAAKIETIAKSLNEFFREHAQPGQEYVEIDPKTLKIQLIILIVFTAMLLLASITLVIGATKRNHKLILPYLVFKVIYFIYSFYEFISNMINDGNKAAIITQFLIFCGISIYLWLCVFSLFQELREQPNAPREAYLMQQQPYNPQVYKPSTIPN